ncbi:hypothetical protein AAVH_41106 [Aphelenchoides avenae]|nr:hypothetical protein AAVH_41106 [Aphelenchus avenae]
MLQEFDKHHDSFNKEFIQSDDCLKEQVFQGLKGASKQVTTVAKKWMRKAATDPVRYRTESQVLQTIRKDLHVLSLQRRVSTRLQELRSACRVADQTSRDQRDDQNDDQYEVRADGVTHTHGLEATLDSAGYIEWYPKPSKPDHLLAKLKHRTSLRTPTKTLSFQHPPEKTTTQLTSRQPEDFQAHREIANHEVLKTSANNKLPPESEITTNAMQTRELPHAANPRTSELQTSIPDQTFKAECQPIYQKTVCCKGGGFLLHRLQEVSDSRCCTLTSFSKLTVVDKLEDPSPATEPDEHACHHPDELEITYQDHSEPISDSEDTDLNIDGCEDRDETEYQDLNEPSSDSDDPDQISDGHDADVLETPYQDPNEPSSDSEDPDQTSDGYEDQDQTGMTDSDQSCDSADHCDKAFSDQSDVADQVEDSFPVQAIDEADEPDSDQFEEPVYESDQFEQPVSERADDDTDAFDEPSSDQDNDQADQFDEPFSDQDNDHADQFDEPFSESDATEQADDGADEYDEPASDAEGPDVDNSDADE